MKGWTAAGRSAHPERLRAPLVPTPRVSWFRRAGTWHSTLATRSAPSRTPRPGRGRRLRRRLAHQREGLPARQVRARRARHRQHRLQRPLLHVVGCGRGHARSASTAGCRFRSRHRRRRAILLVGGNSPRRCRRSCSTSTHSSGRRQADRRRPASHGDGARAAHLRLTPGTDAALANGLLHVLIRERPDRRAYIRGRTEGFEEAPCVTQPLAGTRGADTGVWRA